MSLAAAIPVNESSNIIHLTLVNGGLNKKEIHYNKDGTVDKRHCNKVSGESTEVYPFTKEEIAAMTEMFNQRIEQAADENKKQIAYRDKLLFLIGINIGIRASDLRTLKWSFFFKEDGTFKDFYTLQPIKQRNKGKFVKLFFNDAVKKAINSYVSIYPIEDYDSYLFASRKGNEAITTGSLWRIVKDGAADAGIDKNIGSHSLRKTFGYFCWHNAEDKNKALIILQTIFNHSTSQVTARYIGIADNEMQDMFDSINLGLELI